MSYKEKLFSHTSTRGTGLMIVARGPGRRTAETFDDVIFRRWDEIAFADRGLAEIDFPLNDFEAGGTAVPARSFWNMLLGFAVIAGVSGGFWTGIGLLIARLLR